MDVGIVGAGIIGCAIAEDLSRRGYEVEVFDARQVGGGASQASAGVLAPFIEAPAPGPLQDLAIESLAMYDGFVAAAEAASGLPIEYRRCGTFEVATTADGEDRLQQVAETARAARLTAQWHAADPAARPARGTGFAGLLIPQQGYVRVEQLIAALRRATERRGGIFHEYQAILKTAARYDQVLLETETRSLSCRVLVIAAGSWSDMVGPEETGVHPVRGQILRLRWPGEPLPHVMWSDDCYVVPWLDRTVLVGATVEHAGFDERTTVAGVQQLLASVQRFLPVAAGATFLEARAGLRPASTIGLPIIRPSWDSPRVIYATGHYRNGILLAPLTAQLVGTMVDGVWRRDAPQASP